MDEELLLKVIVHTLLQHPAEWFTYGRMAHDIDVPGVDATLVGAFVDFREDLFATSQDRRSKLHTEVVEQIASVWDDEVEAPQPAGEEKDMGKPQQLPFLFRLFCSSLLSFERRRDFG